MALRLPPHRRRALAAPLAAAMLVAALPQAAIAQGKPAGDMAQRREADQRKENLEKTKKRKESEIELIGRDLARINSQRIGIAQQIQKSEGRLGEIEAKLDQLAEQTKVAQESLGQRRKDIARLLATMQRMGRNLPPAIVTQPDDVLKMFRGEMLLDPVTKALIAKAAALKADLDELDRVALESQREQEHLRAETAELNERRSRLEALNSEKRLLVDERKNEVEQIRKAILDISRNAPDIAELITKTQPIIAEKAGLDAYKQELARQEQQAAARTDPPAAPPPAPPAAGAPPPAKPEPKLADARPPAIALLKPTITPAEPSRPAVELAPHSDVVAMLGPRDPMTPKVPFEKARASLPYPAQGRRVIHFGDKTQYGGSSKGIVIETRQRAQITSPCDGWVVYAGEFRTYGQILIVDAGGGYHILLAGLSQIDVSLGQFVLTGEPVGTMGGPPAQPNKSADGKLPTTSPVLYIEFRKDKRPIDPDPWWVPDGLQKVQG